ncbi:MAG: SP_1767 family glycosyltransferase [Prevotella sp.]|nr:SP_1767 family glycosyltransferase [Prevotella sp.]
MIQTEDKQKCVGCGNCSEVCPLHCISMTQDKEGFLYPVVDTSICINCGKCNSVCPVEKELLSPSTDSLIIGAYHRNTALRMKSSSGGVFPALSASIIEHGGVVYGAVLISPQKVRHIRISQLEDLIQLQGSKYVQSDISHIFPMVLEDLKEGLPVLFSGTPCQVKALHLYLQKPFANLLTVEVVCHGVPSPLVFSKYMDAYQARSIQFRDKGRSWVDYDTTIELRNGISKTGKASHNPYMRAFLQDITIRPSCSACPAKSFTSNADITLGDFWGVRKTAPELFDDKGTSLIFLHTPKALTAWEGIKSDFAYRELSEKEEIFASNPSINKSSTLSTKRDMFFSEMKDVPIKKLLRKYTTQKQPLKNHLKSFMASIWNKAWDTGLGIRKDLYIANDYIFSHFHRKPHVVGIEASIQHILDHHCSVSRYGDGELKIILGMGTWFQDAHPLLQKRLKSILSSSASNHIVCIPNIFSDLGQYTLHDREYWKEHLSHTRKIWYKAIDMDKTYYDAFVSRCYMPYQDKGKAESYFVMWKRVWEKRDLLIIEGEKSRLGVGNDLFDNASSIKRILCPNTQAFSCYDQLLSEALKFDKSHLVLLAIGPSATLLSYDLSEHGYQAIDIGHIDIEYEWFLKKATRKEPVKDKFVNEAGAGRGVGDIHSPQYQAEIICRY